MKNALETALASLSRRAYSCWELTKSLGDKGFSPEEIAEACARLTEWGYLDDRKYALQYAQYRTRHQTRRQVREGLRRRGIGEDIVRGVLAEVYPPEQERENCRAMAERLWGEELARRYRRTGKELKSEDENCEFYAEAGRFDIQAQMLRKARAKVGQKLALRGYPTELIRACLEALRDPE